MSSSLPPPTLMEAMSEATRHDADAAKLQTALISCGAALSAAALSLIVFKAPAPGLSIFLHLHGGAALYLYYGFLVAFVALGIVEVTFGYWVLPRDHYGWRAIGKTMLWVSIFPLVVVAALGGFVLLK